MSLILLAFTAISGCDAPTCDSGASCEELEDANETEDQEESQPDNEDQEESFSAPLEGRWIATSLSLSGEGCGPLSPRSETDIVLELSSSAGGTFQVSLSEELNLRTDCMLNGGSFTCTDMEVTSSDMGGEMLITADLSGSFENERVGAIMYETEIDCTGAPCDSFGVPFPCSYGFEASIEHQ